jgi:hypothetical protein
MLQWSHRRGCAPGTQGNRGDENGE